MKQKFYAKSFEDDFILKIVENNSKKDFQSINNIIKTKIIRPNTKSFGRKKRLACSFLHKNYLKTYRSQGLIFQTLQEPNLIYPFDLVLLTDAKKIIVQYFRIKDNLQIYYNHNLIPGYEKFIFSKPEDLLKKFSTKNKVWESVNEFRIKSGFKELTQSKRRLIEYNEVIFEKAVKIKPVAIFGYKKISREIAKKHNLPHFRSAKIFFENNVK